MEHSHWINKAPCMLSEIWIYKITNQLNTMWRLLSPFPIQVTVWFLGFLGHPLLPFYSLLGTDSTVHFVSLRHSTNVFTQKKQNTSPCATAHKEFPILSRLTFDTWQWSTWLSIITLLIGPISNYYITGHSALCTTRY